MSKPVYLLFSLLVTTAFGVPGAPDVAAAQSGATLTPDGRTFLVNKDLGAERWTISAGLASGDVDAIVSVTGNVFQADGSPPSFVLCQVRGDSTGTLREPASVFRLTCQGTGACTTSARMCARDEWRPIADLVEIPADFFLPPGGLGAVARVGRAPLQGWFGRAAAWLRGTAPSIEAISQQSDRGATLSLDRLSYLVNKDVGEERWSISLNFVPVRTASGGTVNQLSSVTGNVYFPDGREPSFVFCSVREDSTGTLEDQASEFRFRCSGSSACADSAEACAAGAWTAIADDIRLSASFFLPPGGLPPSATSDPDIVVIGRTSDPPAIVTKDFTIDGAGTAAGRAAGGAVCSAGQPCLGNRVGDCAGVPGELVDLPGFGCGCQLADIPPSCIICGQGATGACGATGEYPVGSSIARGVCLPFSGQSTDCIVYAVDATGSEDSVVESCGGTLGATCPGTSCCADDPRDGCSSSGGVSSCSGICVGAADCGSGECDLCLPAATPSPLPTPSPRPTPTPEPTPTTSGLAPEITSFTCNGASSCSLAAGGTSFTLSFSYVDPDGNASAWRLHLDGDLVASDSFSPRSSGSGSVTYVTGTCQFECCSEGDFTYTLVVEDDQGLLSDPAVVVQTTQGTCP